MNLQKSTPGQPHEYRQDNSRAVKPREASTLIIVRQSEKPNVLMGKRAASHKFMPNKFVFPGGRMDPCDRRLKVPGELSSAVRTRLQSETRKEVSEHTGRAFALAAIRETFEETGLIIGKPTSRKLFSSNPVWQRYLAHGVEPPLEDIDFIARATTPPYRTRRFDTRFFMVHEDLIVSDPSSLDRASGELLDLHWLPLAEARELDLPVITRWVLDLIEQRLRMPRSEQKAAPAPYMRFVRGKPVTTLL